MDLKWISLGVRLFPYIAMAVQAVEKLAGARRGKDKQDAAIEVLGASLEALDAGLGKDIFERAEVQAALRALIDAYVQLQNVIARVNAQTQAQQQRIVSNMNALTDGVA